MFHIFSSKVDAIEITSPYDRLRNSGLKKKKTKKDLLKKLKSTGKKKKRKLSLRTYTLKSDAVV